MEYQNDSKNFFEEFRVFAIKMYISYPYLIKNLNLLNSFVYDNIDLIKDNKILNSLNKNNDFNR